MPVPVQARPGGVRARRGGGGVVVVVVARPGCPPGSRPRRRAPSESATQHPRPARSRWRPAQRHEQSTQRQQNGRAIAAAVNSRSWRRDAVPLPQRRPAFHFCPLQPRLPEPRRTPGTATLVRGSACGPTISSWPRRGAALTVSAASASLSAARTLVAAHSSAHTTASPSTRRSVMGDEGAVCGRERKRRLHAAAGRNKRKERKREQWSQRPRSGAAGQTNSHSTHSATCTMHPHPRPPSRRSSRWLPFPKQWRKVDWALRECWIRGKPSRQNSSCNILLTMAPFYFKLCTALLVVLLHAPAFGETVISRRMDRFGGCLRTNRWAELPEIERQSVGV